MGSYIDTRIANIQESQFLKLIRFSKFATEILERARRVYFLAISDETPILATLLALIGVTWIVFPWDFDFIPYIGWIDDVTILQLCEALVTRVSSDEANSKANEYAERSVRGQLKSILETGVAVRDSVVELLMPIVYLILLPFAIAFWVEKAMSRGYLIYFLIHTVVLAIGIGFILIFPSHPISNSLIDSAFYLIGVGHRTLIQPIVSNLRLSVTIGSVVLLILLITEGFNVILRLMLFVTLLAYWFIPLLVVDTVVGVQNLAIVISGLVFGGAVIGGFAWTYREIIDGESQPQD